MKSLTLLAAIATLALPCGSASAQSPTRTPTAPAPAIDSGAAKAARDSLSARLGRPVTNQDVLEAIRRSGLSEQEIRARMQAAGYDPSLADPFFAAPGERPRGAADPLKVGAFASALDSLGIALRIANPEDSLTRRTTDTDSMMTDVRALTSGERAKMVFGKDVFRRGSAVFDPVSVGPVDASYRLGVGDQLQLVLTGGVEQAYQVAVRRDGSIIIPQVGQISVAGLTLEGARALVRDRAAQAYSGIATGRTSVDLSVARVRTNQVFVIGEVEAPGSYQVNALATVFHAIARAGGPTSKGSFRSIELRRGGRVVRRIDLYDYLLDGEASSDIRLEQGDMVFVPLNSRSVTVTGAVRRPATFELREGEGFRDLLRFSGGLLPEAATERLQIDRILPADQRRPGHERTLVDVRIGGRLDSLGGVPLADGDVVTAFKIGGVRRNTVALVGEVYQAGVYELRPGMTLEQLMSAAQGFMPWALMDRIKISRVDPGTGIREMRSVDYADPAARAVPLVEFDSVFVFDRRLLYPTGRIVVAGAVNRPDTTMFSEGETLKDAIDRAGGLRLDAATVDVARRRIGAEYNDTTSVLFTFRVERGTGRNDLESGARTFQLQRDDRVFVRSAPGFREQRFVRVEGLFRYPGTYALTASSERVSDIVKRAGGTLPGAYAESFRLLRDGKLVAIDFSRALAGDPRHDILLASEDLLSIAPNPSTVYVRGEVERSALVLWQPGLSLNDYINLAGGARPTGDVKAAIVDYPSGLVRRSQTRLKVFHSTPDVVAGSVITVPAKPAATPFSVERFLSQALQYASTIASLAIAYVALKK